MAIIGSAAKPEELFDELSLSDDDSEFLEVEDEANLRKRLFPTPLLPGDVPTLVCNLILLLKYLF